MNENEILMRLILGNIGDETALRNICEAHHLCVDELTPREREYMYATNSFYYNAQEFNTIHHEETEELLCKLTMKEGEKFEEGMKQGRQEGLAEGLSGEAGMSEAFERLHITVDYEEQQKSGTMTPLMRLIRAKSQNQLIFCLKYCIL